MAKRERVDPEPDVTAEIVPRVSVPLTPEGAIDLDRMRSEKREQLRRLVKNTPGLIEMPLPGEPSTSDTQALALVANMAYQVLGQLAMLLAMRTMPVTSEQAQIFLFTDAERVTLTPLTSRVLAKYLPSITTRYADELALAGTLTAMTMQKITALRELQAVKAGGELVATDQRVAEVK